jgi:hypothetical protein
MTPSTSSGGPPGWPAKSVVGPWAAIPQAVRPDSRATAEAGPPGRRRSAWPPWNWFVADNGSGVNAALSDPVFWGLVVVPGAALAVMMLLTDGHLS